MLLLGGDFINLVNLGLIVCTDSYVEKALPECDVSVLKFFEEDDGQTKSPLCSTKLSIGNKSAGLACQKY